MSFGPNPGKKRLRENAREYSLSLRSSLDVKAGRKAGLAIAAEAMAAAGRLAPGAFSRNTEPIQGRTAKILSGAPLPPLIFIGSA